MRRAGVVDGFARLGHDAIVRCDDDHGDIGHLRAAGPHRGESLVAGRVEERNRTAVDLDLVGADVLGDAARLTRRDARVADHIQQTGLAVVDVAHDGDHRRPWLEEARVLCFLGRGAGCSGLRRAISDGRRDRGRWGRRGHGHGHGCHALLANLEAEIRGNDGSRVIVECLVDGCDGAVGEEGLDDLGDGHAKNARQVRDANDGRQLDRANLGGAGRGRTGRLGSAAFEGFELTAPPAAGLARAVRWA